MTDGTGSGTWIASQGVGAGLGLVALALVALAVVVHRRARRARRARRPVGWGARSPWLLWPAAVVALVLAVAVSVNARVGYVPDTAALGTWLAGQGIGAGAVAAAGATGTVSGGGAGAGTVQRVQLPDDPALGVQDDPAFVYTPPGYDPAHRRYPVVYLLHGSPGTPADWFAGGQAAATLDRLIDAGAIAPVIAVSPDLDGTSTTDTECLDSTRGGPQVETYLQTVVVPYVDTHYPTVADRSGRMLAGMSSGGYCALDQGLRHADAFSAIAAIEPYTEPGDGGRGMLATLAEQRAHDVARYLPTLPLPQPVHVFVDQAGEELQSLSGRESTRLVALLRERGVDVEYRTEVGQEHSWTTARLALPHALVDLVPELAAPAPTTGAPSTSAATTASPTPGPTPDPTTAG